LTLSQAANHTHKAGHFSVKTPGQISVKINNWRQDRPPWPVDYLPNGRGDGAWCSVPENPGRYRGAPAVAARPILEDQRQTGPIWLPAGDLRPEAGSRVQILAHTAIVGQSARLQPSSQAFHRCRTPGLVATCLRDGQGGRSSGESRFRLVRPIPLIPCRDSRRADPEEKRGSARDITRQAAQSPKKRLTSQRRIEKSPTSGPVHRRGRQARLMGGIKLAN
jgi:hypothetical protein